jgi:integrase
LRVDASLAEVAGELIFGPTKSHAARSVPLPDSLAASIDRHLERVGGDAEALLFTSARGLPLRYSRFRPTVWVPNPRRARTPADRDTRPPTLGRGADDRAAWPAKAVQQVLGHPSASFTLTVYGHLLDDDLDELAAALDGTSRGTSRYERSARRRNRASDLAPGVGLEPTTYGLTVRRSAN